MSDTNSLEALLALHRELVALSERRSEAHQLLLQSLGAYAELFRNLLDKPARKKQSRDAVESGLSP